MTVAIMCKLAVYVHALHYFHYPMWRNNAFYYLLTQHIYVLFCNIALQSTYMNLTTLETPLVGKPLILDCSVSTVAGISSTVDIVWSSNNVILAMNENINISFTENISAVYVGYYEIPQVTTADDGRVYECQMSINQNPPLISDSFITLDVTGNFLTVCINKCFIVYCLHIL